MSDPVPVLRGYRPSRVVYGGTDSDDRESLRLANLERYMLRARAGMPIFDEPDEAEYLAAELGGIGLAP